MKKFYTLLLATFTFFTVLHAQEKGKTEFGFGIGVNYSTVTNGDQTNTKYRTSPNFGVSADYYFSDRWSLKGKLIYDPKGWDNGYLSVENNTYPTDYHVDYLTIPVMANWHFGRTRNWYLNFGPYLGILLSANETAGNLDLKDEFHKVDGGIAYGIGVKIPVGNNIKFYVEFDGQAGMANIVKTTDGSSLNNSRGAFNIGINF